MKRRSHLLFIGDKDMSVSRGITRCHFLDIEHIERWEDIITAA